MGNQRRQDARRAGAGVLDYSTSNDELERRCTAARLARERTLSSSARGAQPQTHHGPLQRLLGSRICGLRTMVCDARLRNAQRAFCHKCGATAEAHRLILQLPQRVVRSNETLGVLGYLNVSYRCAARNISRGICDSYLRGSRTKRELRWRAAQEASDVTENHQKSYCANHGDYLNDGAGRGNLTMRLSGRTQACPAPARHGPLQPLSLNTMGGDL